VALVLRLVSGPLADRSGRYWALTIVGYAMTALCVPLMAVAPFLGGAGLVFACTLVLLERAGKAVRSPSKSALLASAAQAVGRGRGFAVHKALDQVGAFAGPLLIAAVVALTSAVWAGLAVLAVPAMAAMVLLIWMRARVPDMTVYAETAAELSTPVPSHLETAGLPTRFRLFALASAASTLGLMTFGLISFHLVEADLVSAPGVPLIYAAAMAAGSVSALGTGFAYDRWGPRILVLLPFLVAAVPLLSLADRLWVAVSGVVVWGAAVGCQDSTVKALVADLVPAPRLATAYGVFAAFQGAAALAGGVVAGALYDDGTGDLVVVIAVTQVASLLLTLVVTRKARTSSPSTLT